MGWEKWILGAVDNSAALAGKVIRFSLSAFIALIFLCPANAFAAQRLDVERLFKEGTVNVDADLFEDKDKTLTIDDVLTPAIQTQFRPVEYDSLNIGFTASNCWFRFTVRNPFDRELEWFLELPDPLPTTVEFYFPKKDGHGELRTSYALPFSSRPLQYRIPTFPFSQPPHSEQVFFVNINYLYSGPINGQMRLITAKKLLEDSNADTLENGLYFGAIAIMLIYNLFIFFSTREKAYLYYVIYVAAMLACNLTLSAYSIQYFFTNNGLWVAERMADIGGNLASIFSILFAKEFLDTKKNSPLFDRFWNAMLFLFVVVTLLLFSPYYAFAVQIDSILFLPTMLLFINGIVVYLRGIKAARFYIVGWIFFTVGLSIWELKNIGLLPLNAFTGRSLTMGNLFEVALLSFALADRINFMKTEREHLIRSREVTNAANKAKSDFLADMSHELRTPLNSMTGMMQLALAAPSWGKAREYLGMMKLAGGVLLEQVNEILDLSRIEAGKLELKKDNFNLRQFLEKAVSIFSAEAEKKGVAIHRSVDERIPPLVHGDEARIRQVLINLIGNSLKFTPAGRIDVLVRCAQVEGNALELNWEIRDTGIGIPKEKIAQVFEMYGQAHDARFGGTGLGMNIAKKLIEAMGGKIWVESELNKGTVFHFTVVVSVMTDGLVSRENAQDGLSLYLQPGVPSRHLKIVLAEDDVLSQRFMHDLLVKHGHSVRAVKNGEEVLALNLEGYDLIVMDNQMPVMGGIETASLIRNREQGNDGRRKITIVGLTANTFAGDREKNLAAGMDEYLTKPLNIDEFFKAIYELLSVEWRPDGVAVRPSGAESGLYDIEAVRYFQSGDEEAVRAFMVSYFERLEKQIHLLREHIEKHDLPNIEDLAHKISGSAGQIKADVVAHPAKMLMRNAREGVWAGAEELHGELVRGYTTLYSALKGELGI